MGRRSAHTAEELRELILGASTEIIETQGYAAFSAREIARRIGYSPGTLYNVFENLDDLVLTIEGRMLDRLAQALVAVQASGDPREHLRRLAEAYLRFTHANPKLWNLLFEHHMSGGVKSEVPGWYQSKLEALLSLVEQAIAPLVPDRDPLTVRRAARVLWAGVHGITSLSTTDKLSIVSTEAAASLVDDLVETYIDGLAFRAAGKS